jgi:dipeptidase
MRRTFSLGLLLLTLFLLTNTSSEACTNFLVTKGASTDGSTFITYNADSHQLFGELYFRPATDYPDGILQKIYEWDTGKYLGDIPQVKHTYSVIGNMNEFQLSIGETTYGGREELVDSTAIVDYEIGRAHV